MSAISDKVKPLVILITGSREWDDQELIDKILDEYSDRQVTLIHGDCKGVDKKCGKSATRYPTWKISARPAQWINKYGSYAAYAGPQRNSNMVKEALEYKKNGIDTIVLAFHDDLEKSRGTKDCVKKAIKAGLTVRYISHNK